LTAVDSQQPRWKEAVQRVQRIALETHAGVSRLQNAIERVAPQPNFPLDDRGVSTDTGPRLNSTHVTQLRTYTRHDLRLVRKISSSPRYFGSRNALTVSLHEAQRCKDDQVVLVKTYEGSDPRRRASEVGRARWVICILLSYFSVFPGAFSLYQHLVRRQASVFQR